MIDKKQTLPPKTGFPSQYAASLRKYESGYDFELSRYEQSESNKIELEIQYDTEYLLNQIDKLNQKIKSATVNKSEYVKNAQSYNSLVPIFIIVSAVLGFLGSCMIWGHTLDTVVICGVVGGIVGAIVDAASASNAKANAERITQDIENRIAGYKKEIKDIDMKISQLSFEEQENKKKLKKEVEKAREEYKDKINKARLEYEQEFKQRVNDLSVKYIESDLIKEKRLIEWIMEGFGSHIDTADRNNYQKSVSVPYKFSVYTNKITCARGTFDFYTHRCRNFEYPEQQVAIATVIANELEIRTVMNYPKNIRDIESIVTYDIKYINNAVVEVTLTYNAINGNYKPLSNW